MNSPCTVYQLAMMQGDRTTNHCLDAKIDREETAQHARMWCIPPAFEET
jgi:hypothetical protein